MYHMLFPMTSLGLQKILHQEVVGCEMWEVEDSKDVFAGHDETFTPLNLCGYYGHQVELLDDDEHTWKSDLLSNQKTILL